MDTSLKSSEMMDVNIRIPKVDFKRMKGIAKAMGWDIYRTETHTSAEIKAAQEAYVRETLTRALKELEETDTKNGNQQTLDEFLNEFATNS